MNYLELNYMSLLKKYYLYVDTDYYYADDFFIKNNVNVKFLTKEINITKYNQRYNILFIKIPKQQEEIFIKCMNRLNDKLVSNNLEVYNEICEDLNIYVNTRRVKKKVKV